MKTAIALAADPSPLEALLPESHTESMRLAVGAGQRRSSTELFIHTHLT
jgi:hypothetical protein